MISQDFIYNEKLGLIYNKIKTNVCERELTFSLISKPAYHFVQNCS